MCPVIKACLLNLQMVAGDSNENSDTTFPLGNSKWIIEPSWEDATRVLPSQWKLITGAGIVKVLIASGYTCSSWEKYIFSMSQILIVWSLLAVISSGSDPSSRCWTCRIHPFVRFHIRHWKSKYIPWWPPIFNTLIKFRPLNFSDHSKARKSSPAESASVLLTIPPTLHIRMKLSEQPKKSKSREWS